MKNITNALKHLDNALKAIKLNPLIDEPTFTVKSAVLGELTFSITYRDNKPALFVEPSAGKDTVFTVNSVDYRCMYAYVTPATDYNTGIRLTMLRLHTCANGTYDDSPTPAARKVVSNAISEHVDTAWDALKGHFQAHQDESNRQSAQYKIELCIRELRNLTEVAALIEKHKQENA